MIVFIPTSFMMVFLTQDNYHIPVSQYLFAPLVPVRPVTGILVLKFLVHQANISDEKLVPPDQEIWSATRKINPGWKDAF